MFARDGDEIFKLKRGREKQEKRREMRIAATARGKRREAVME